jgi:diaminohydroxyphosphoribosylaminopyrimidine deaminase/5-amino-6-(5-phosphoribosylamino)uracil reductase
LLHLGAVAGPTRWNSEADGHSPDESTGACHIPPRSLPAAGLSCSYLRKFHMRQQAMNDEQAMQMAVEVAATARLRTSPNPWVGCVIVCRDGRVLIGATEPPGQRHAERVAIDVAVAAGADLRGATVYTTLEPCSHHGRTPPCTDALIEAGVARVVAAIVDPDTKVAGDGIAALRAAGIECTVGVGATGVARQLAPYLHHRRNGRPFVVLKLAATLDGRTAAADGSSQWITGVEARTAAHQLRAECDAIIVGAGTVRADNPSLTTRLVDGPSPRRVVLGHAPADAAVHPCLEWTGSIEALLDHLGAEGALQVMVEGGASVAASFHRGGFVDRYVMYLAPALMGGDDGLAMLTGQGAPTIADTWRGHVESTRMVGNDLEVILEPHSPNPAKDTPDA